MTTLAQQLDEVLDEMRDYFDDYREPFDEFRRRITKITDRALAAQQGQEVSEVVPQLPDSTFKIRWDYARTAYLVTVPGIYNCEVVPVDDVLAYARQYHAANTAAPKQQAVEVTEQMAEAFVLIVFDEANVIYGCGETNTFREALVKAVRENIPMVAAPKQQAVEWEPIETAPKDGSRIMLANEHGVWMADWRPVYQSGYRPENPWGSAMLNLDHIPLEVRYVRATHWKPLPALPGKTEVDRG